MNIQNTLMAPLNDLSAIGPIQGITIIVPDRSHVALASVFRDFFTSLDQFTNAETPRDVSVYTLDSCPTHDQAHWRNRTVVFWSDFHARWQLNQKQLGRAHQLLRLSRQCVLVGGGVFVLCKSVFASRTVLAVHSNLRFVAEEEGLFCLDTGAPFAIDGRICSATSIFAALRLFLKLLEAEMGGFSAATFGDYVGLEVSGEPFHGKQEHIIKRYSGGDRIIGEGVAVMLEHLENTLSIVQIAQIMNVSSRQLQRRFATQLGVSPLTVYRSLRLERANQLVQQTSYSLHEIAAATGFGTRSSLVRSYKKQFGMSPTDARAKTF